MSLGWPTAAAACFFASSAGRFVHPSSPIPAAMAPELTSTTSTPDSLIWASSLARRAIRGRSRCPPSRVRRLVPILTTKRPIPLFDVDAWFFIVQFIEKFRVPHLHRIPRLNALTLQLLFDAHLL